MASAGSHFTVDTTNQVAQVSLLLPVLALSYHGIVWFSQVKLDIAYGILGLMRLWLVYQKENSPGAHCMKAIALQNLLPQNSEKIYVCH